MKSKKEEVTNGFSIIKFDIGTVAGGGASSNLPQFASRLYYETNQIRDILNGKMFDKSLEIGAGYGRLSPLIAEYSKKHHAIEPATELYEISRNLYSNISFVNTTAENLPYTDNTFDFIINATLLICEYTKKTPSSSTFSHTIEEYSTLFEGFQLQETVDRITELGYFTGHVMVFTGIEKGQ